MLKRNSLTSLRFLAAFMVVGSHYFSFAGFLKPLNEIFHKGYLGVDFFFILSGYVMGLRYSPELQKGSFDSKTFFINRMARIFPAYYLSLVVSIPLLVRGTQISSFLQDFAGKLIFVITNLTFTQAVIPFTSLIEHWNLPAWSLSVEFFFYLSFPVLAVPFLNVQGPVKKILAMFILSSLVYFMTLNLPDSVHLLRFQTKLNWMNNPLVRLPQFFLGLAISQIKPPRGFLMSTGKWSAIVLSVALFILPLSKSFVSTGSPISTMSFALLIYFVSHSDDGKGFLNWGPLILFGEASYALYIMQVPMKNLFQQIWSKVFHLGMTSGLLYCAYIAITLTLTSVLIFKLFELPLNQYLRKKLK
jgi:peptidoglycan/LPS O-acetylase OafA/YrhL